MISICERIVIKTKNCHNNKELTFNDNNKELTFNDNNKELSWVMHTV
jgi:hypothetical protein